MLNARGVTGSGKHLAKLAHDLRGHALALNLVARYLVIHHGGDARRADLMPDLVHVGGDDERDPYRVLSAYEIEFTKEIERQLARASHKWLRRLKLARLFKLDHFKAFDDRRYRRRRASSSRCSICSACSTSPCRARCSTR